MTTLYFAPREITEDNMTVRITKSGNWVNINVINEYQRSVKQYGYNRAEKRWSYGDKPAPDSVAWKVLTTNPVQEVMEVEAPAAAEAQPVAAQPEAAPVAPRPFPVTVTEQGEFEPVISARAYAYRQSPVDY